VGSKEGVRGEFKQSFSTKVQDIEKNENKMWSSIIPISFVNE